MVYSDILVFIDVVVNFNVGKIIGIIGFNGVGKLMMIKVMFGLIKF